ncbi:heparanase-like isoform X1 [Haliotis rufescens]|uniref:heparanase-like isoform X1 n=2 Tax=Haliotis rufescens TaxID=6454 RepID=UPI00201ED37C|nr:heparanase-like isoform X1 [Haliotis rufescens]XP_048250500.1 heparanase-like isoform X1 [Haliotis rufescens]XP_048250551.1 heparanase-like isoform X1 [Haliotis rufescens]
MPDSLLKLMNVNNVFLEHTQIEKHIFSVNTWDDLNMYVHKIGLKLVIGLNLMLRDGTKWNPSNAKQLLKYSSDKGYTFAGIELGNEPNLYYRHWNTTVSDVQLGSDYKELKQVLQGTAYKDSLILGPDIAGYKDKYIKTFLSHGGASVIDVLTINHYYFDGHTAKLKDFSNYSIMDHLIPELQTVMSTIRSYNGLVAWLGETSSGYGGGTPGIGNRYVAGNLWLDKLGVSAKYGLKRVLRQSLFGGHYSLIDNNNDPTPDYWLTLLYKRLVGNKVFDVPSSSNNLRLYAHCTNLNNVYNYMPGSITVYALNLNSDPVILTISDLNIKSVDIFWLTPEGGDLKSQKVQLNGKTLELVHNHIPHMTPKTLGTGTMRAPGFGFIVIPDANIAACRPQSHGPIIG